VKRTRIKRPHVRRPRLVTASPLEVQRAADTYSADVLQNEGRVRGLFVHGGDTFVCVGTNGSRSEATIVQVVNPCQWSGMQGRTYEYSYEGRRFDFYGEHWVMTRRQIRLTT